MRNQNLFERDYFLKNSVYKKFLTPAQGAAGLNNYYFGLYKLLKKIYLGNSIPRARVLELGCGYSGLLPHFLSDGYDYTGLDVSGYIVAEMGKIYPDVAFIQHDIQNPLDGFGQFDLILALEVLEHVPNIDRGLKNIANMLGPGGLFLATVPNPRSRVPLTDWRRDPTHINIHPKETWVRNLESHGFSKVRATTIFSIPFFWKFNRFLNYFFTIPEFGASILLRASR